MERKLFTVTDLGGGDGGKGGVVHKISSFNNAHTILKVGGAQGSHGVRTSAGQSFNFSQFGCGTFEGARTHITNLMVIEPYRLLAEGDELVNEWGISNAFDLLTIDEEALCITPYHTIASRLRELSRKDNPKGTVGIGGGSAVFDSGVYPDLAIRAKDLGQPYLRERLEAVRHQKLIELSAFMEKPGDFWSADQENARKNIALLRDEGFVDRIVGHFNLLASRTKVVDRTYLKEDILQKDGVVVVESSHGILTDRYYGFHPHTTKLRTTLQPTLELLRECEYDGEIVKLGVTRGYQIRHGAGPMVTESDSLLGELLPGSHKDENRWQGKVRVGALDLVALRYAIEVCGGPHIFDGLAITWFDQVRAAGAWHVCSRYEGADDQEFFTPDGEIKVWRGRQSEQLRYQKRLGEQLMACRPEVHSYEISSAMSQEEVSQICTKLLGEKLRVPVKMISFGPTENDKVLL